MGLMSSVMSPGGKQGGPPAGPTQGGPPQGQQPTEDEGPIQDSEATPEEQQEFDKAMVAVGRILYKAGLIEKFALQIKESNDPAGTLADLTSTVVKTVDEKSQGMIPETMLVPVATDTLGMLAEGAIAAGAKLNGTDVAKAAQYLIENFMQEFGASEEEVSQMRSMIDTNSVGQAIDNVMVEGDAE